MKKRKTITIEVTRDLILEGKQGNTTRCPVALALLRQLPNAAGVAFVNRFTLEWGPQFRVRTPTKVREFIVAYDRGDIVGVKPFSFRVNPWATWGTD